VDEVGLFNKLKVLYSLFISQVVLCRSVFNPRLPFNLSNASCTGVHFLNSLKDSYSCFPFLKAGPIED